MRLLHYILIVFIAIIMVGCSLHRPKPFTYQEKKELLSKRFVGYWEARTKGDYKKSWLYELPFQRYLKSYKWYKEMAPGYKGVQVKLNKILSMTQNEAIIERKILYSKKNWVLKKDKWFYIKDNWYHKFYQSVFPPETQDEAEFQ